MDAAEDREQDLHDKRMARLKRERDELKALRAALQLFMSLDRDDPSYNHNDQVYSWIPKQYFANGRAALSAGDGK